MNSCEYDMPGYISTPYSIKILSSHDSIHLFHDQPLLPKLFASQNKKITLIVLNPAFFILYTMKIEILIPPED